MGKRRKGRLANHAAIVSLCILLPALIGGCPEFRNEVVDAFETAGRGLVDAALDLFFDQFRTDDVS